MTRPIRHRSATGIAVAFFTLAAMFGFVPGASDVFVGAASAAPISYNASATSGQFILKKGDPTNQQIIDNPTVALTSTVDNTTGAITANATFQPAYTPNMAGPFGLVIYIKADIIQQSAFTGTIDPNGALDATGQQIMAITVYRTTTGTVGQNNGQNPATDQILANGNTCRVTLDLHVTGTYDFNTRVSTFGQDPFTIPNFPADTRPSGGTAGCASATSGINTQLAGASNSVTLTFGGPAALPPGAPGLVTATSGNGQATLDGPAPVDYGSPIDHYTVTPYIAGVAQPTQEIPAAGPPVVTGLVNGVTYTFTVTAHNANGDGPASAPSNAVLIGVPGRPGFQTASANGGGSATVAWWPPDENGSPILSSTVTPYLGGVAQPAQTFLGNGNVQNLTGLAPGSYTFTVHVTNAAGNSPESAPTAAISVT